MPAMPANTGTSAGALFSLAELASGTGFSGPVGLAGQQTWLELARLRDAWRDGLAAAGARRVAVYFGNTFEFAAALLGAWAAGCTVVLAADAAQETVAALKGRAEILLGDFPEGSGAWRVPPGSAGSAESAEPAGSTVRAGSAVPAPITPRPFPAIPLVLFTSGSTGRPVAIEKAASDIDRELATLEAVFGGASDVREVLATVGHQHIYGLLFRCLWPLASGRPFSDRIIRYPEELAEALSRPGRALVSSPAFLKRLPEPQLRESALPELHLPELSPHAAPDASQAATRASATSAGIAAPAAVYSSGGPLPWDAAMACRRLFGLYPAEIYGSSETGGVAWRIRTEEASAWTLFPGVEVDADGDGALVIRRSPHLAAAPFATSDRVRLVENGLILLGRMDRIVKIEEKRLSLTAMEERLAAHPGVAEARVVALPGDRVLLGAVVRLRGGAIPVRGTPERAALVEDLRRHLLQAFERPLLPRRWRLVEALPANAAGKATQAALEALFEPQYGPAIVDARYVVEEGDGRDGRTRAKAVHLDLEMPAELEHFQGHFPEHPLLPGIVQLDWAIREGTDRLGPFGAFQGMRKLKFQRPIFPGMTVTLELVRLKDGEALGFAYQSAAGSHSSGQIQFGS